MRFADRADAGAALAGPVAELLATASGPDHIGRPEVLALPRGGVPLARPVAGRLGARLRLLSVRKVGVPSHPELAMGAIAAIGDDVKIITNAEVLLRYRIGEADWDRTLAAERSELLRRTAAYADWTAAPPDGATVVLVDDGLATGATMRAAVATIRAAGAGTVVVAVPVASRQAVSDLERDGVAVIALSRPDPLIAVGEAYRDFHQLTDEEVLAELAEQ